MHQARYELSRFRQQIHRACSIWITGSMAPVGFRPEHAATRSCEAHAQAATAVDRLNPSNPAQRFSCAASPAEHHVSCQPPDHRTPAAGRWCGLSSDVEQARPGGELRSGPRWTGRPSRSTPYPRRSRPPRERTEPAGVPFPPTAPRHAENSARPRHVDQHLGDTGNSAAFGDAAEDARSPKRRYRRRASYCSAIVRFARAPRM